MDGVKPSIICENGPIVFTAKTASGIVSFREEPKGAGRNARLCPEPIGALCRPLAGSDDPTGR